LKIEHWLTRLDEALVRNKKWLIALAVGAFALKVIYVLESAGSLQIRVPIMDAKYYDKTARDILAGNVLRREAFFMGPLYSYFLAVVYGVFGRDFTLIRIIQAAGGSLTVVLTYLLGKRVFRPSVGLLGALLLIFYGASTFYETQLLMMWIGALLNTAMLLALVSIRPDAGPRSYILPGALLGVSALARANILVFWPVAAVWILFVQKVPARWPKAAVFAAAAIVAIMPATIHNYIASRDFVPVTSNAGINFYIGNSEMATGIFYPPPGTDFVTDSTTRNYVERLMGRDMSPSEVSDYWFGKAVAFVRANPAAALKLLGRKFGMFFNASEVPQIESYDLTKRRNVSLKLLFVNMWFLGTFGILGLLFSIPRWRRLLPFQGYVIAYALSIIVFFVTARYRVQIAPVIALFAGYALIDCLPRFLTDVRKGFGVAGAFVLILFLMQPRLFALDQKEVAFREHVHEARRASMVGEYKRAVNEIDKAVGMFPDYHEGYIHRAIIHKESRDFFKAIEDYTRALELRPDLSSAHYDLGQTLRQVNLKRQAIEEYKKAIEIDPLMIKAHNNLGITHAELGQFNEAVKYFERVIEMDPSYVKAYNNMGVLLAQNDRVDEAIAVFHQAIARDAEYANSYKNLANAYISKKQVQPAIEALTRYLELEPDDNGARENLQKLFIAAAHDSTAASPGDAQAQ
jgi:Tfp pilus assembly protein PilF/4-amino-4-deoxy-L-arabinose transferase-like glycosyltransferase